MSWLPSEELSCLNNNAKKNKMFSKFKVPAPSELHTKRMDQFFSVNQYSNAASRSLDRISVPGDHPLQSNMTAAGDTPPPIILDVNITEAVSETLLSTDRRSLLPCHLCQADQTFTSIHCFS